MAITSFRGPHSFLSNFSPCTILHVLRPYPSVEHAYQASKTFDGAWKQHIREAKTPGEAKRLGRLAPLRHDWDEALKLFMMREFLAQKFSFDLYRSQLIATGTEELIEGNTWGDRFWGMCDGEGENWLGKLLMERRSTLRETS